MSWPPWHTSSTPWAFGLDEAGWAILSDGEVAAALGSGVYTIKMSDFATQEHTITRLA